MYCNNCITYVIMGHTVQLELYCIRTPTEWGTLPLYRLVVLSRAQCPFLFSILWSSLCLVFSLVSLFYPLPQIATLYLLRLFVYPYEINMFIRTVTIVRQLVSHNIPHSGFKYPLLSPVIRLLHLISSLRAPALPLKLSQVYFWRTFHNQRGLGSCIDFLGKCISLWI